MSYPHTATYLEWLLWLDFNLALVPAVALVVGSGPYFDGMVALIYVKVERHSTCQAVHVEPETQTLPAGSVADGTHNSGRVAMDHTIPLNIHVKATYI